MRNLQIRQTEAEFAKIWTRNAGIARYDRVASKMLCNCTMLAIIMPQIVVCHSPQLFNDILML